MQQFSYKLLFSNKTAFKSSTVMGASMRWPKNPCLPGGSKQSSFVCCQICCQNQIKSNQICTHVAFKGPASIVGSACPGKVGIENGLSRSDPSGAHHISDSLLFNLVDSIMFLLLDQSHLVRHVNQVLLCFVYLVLHPLQLLPMLAL